MAPRCIPRSSPTNRLSLRPVDAMAALGRLHVIVNPTPGFDAHVLAKQVLDAGAPLLQIRAKGVDDASLPGLVEPLVEICHDFGAVAVVNDRADVCLAAGADGVHVGADDLPVAAARRVVGPDRLVGGTARNSKWAGYHADDGADYVGVGPVYATTTKGGLPAAFGPDVIEQVSRSVDIPVIAIAGVTIDRVPELLEAGAHGVAVIGAISSAPDPAAATRGFLEALEGR